MPDLAGLKSAIKKVLGLTAASTEAAGTTDTQTLTNKTLTTPVISSVSNSGTITIPTGTDTLVGKATTDTLTNKSISGSTNTLTNVPDSALSTNVALEGTSNLFTEIQEIEKDNADLLTLHRLNGGVVGTGIRFLLGDAPGVHYASIYGFAVTSSPQVGRLAIWLPNSSAPAEKFAFHGNGSLTIVDGGSIIAGSTSGLKIGTATTQKLGFFNKTPIVQPAANADTSGASLAALETEVNQVKQTLRDLGLMA